METPIQMALSVVEAAQIKAVRIATSVLGGLPRDEIHPVGVKVGGVNCFIYFAWIDGQWANLFPFGNRLPDLNPPHLVKPVGGGEPIAMILHCPDCGQRHVDEFEWAERPHHTHVCQHCGFVWRPAICASFGVQFLPGFKNDGAAQ